MFYVYLIISEKFKKFKTYVGYTNNLKKRLNKHNSNKGAKSTRGRIWKIIFKKKFKTKKINIHLSLADEKKHSIAFVVLGKK